MHDTCVGFIKCMVIFFLSKQKKKFCTSDKLIFSSCKLKIFFIYLFFFSFIPGVWSIDYILILGIRTNLKVRLMQGVFSIVNENNLSLKKIYIYNLITHFFFIKLLFNLSSGAKLIYQRL